MRSSRPIGLQQFRPKTVADQKSGRSKTDPRRVRIGFQESLLKQLVDLIPDHIGDRDAGSLLKFFRLNSFHLPQPKNQDFPGPLFAIQRLPFNGGILSGQNTLHVSCCALVIGCPFLLDKSRGAWSESKILFAVPVSLVVAALKS